jgi:hypothetical protein
MYRIDGSNGDMILTSNDVLNALRQWQQPALPENVTPLLRRLSHFSHVNQHGSPRLALNALLGDALRRLEGENAYLADLLLRRFVKGEKVLTIANALNVSESKFHEIQRAAVERLTTIILEVEAAARKGHAATVLQRLGVKPGENLIGLDTHMQTLLPILADPESAGIVSIEGMGGLGKSALAGALASRLLYTDGVWNSAARVTARQTYFQLHGQLMPSVEPVPTVEAAVLQLHRSLLGTQPPAAEVEQQQLVADLHHYFKNNKSLILIENLEEMVDVEALVDLLRHWVEPSKFILTSRKSFYGVNGVYHYQMNPLAHADALALIRSTAAAGNLTDVVLAAVEELQPIVDAVGGNGLALRFLIHQLHIYGLDEILADLTGARGEVIENLYTFLFQDSWIQLSVAAKQVLAAIGNAAPDGITMQALALVCPLPYGEIQSAIKQLVVHNLVDNYGSLRDRRYRVHEITRTYLQAAVMTA